MVAKLSRKKEDSERRFDNLQKALLCTPYVKGFDYGITEEIFLRDLYCDPDFSNRIKNIEKEIEELNKRDPIVINEEELLDLTKEKNKLQQYSESQQRFEKELIDNNWQGARYICGYSGSGKSTYLGYLLNKLKQNHHKVYKIDLATSVKEPNFLCDGWHNKYFQLTLNKFVSVLLQTLDSMIKKETKENEEDYRKRIKKYYSYYNEIYYENERFANFFEIIKLYIDNEICRYERNAKSLYKKLAEHVIEKLNTINLGNVDYSDIEKIINSLLGLISLFAMADAAQGDAGKFSIKHKIIIAIDSLEHYIQNDKVFNSDIVRICAIIDEFIANQNNFYRNLIEEDFSSIVKFIVVFRDTTAKMMPNRNAEDNAIEDLNITEWFLPASIAAKRFNYCISQCKKRDEEKIKALETIMSDDCVNHSFFDRLVEMHNYNKRRLFFYIDKALDDNAVKHYLDLIKEIDNYNKLLTASTGISKNHYIKYIQTYKNATRSSIIRLLFSEIEKKQYFRNIYVEEENADCMGKSYARRILTYINGQKPDEERIEQNNYVSFSQLLTECFNINDSVDPDRVIYNIAKVLYEMSNSNRDNTNWCQLIIIKFNDQEYDQYKLVEKLQSIKNGGEDSTEKYGVKITSAGRFFLTKMADYEYFACRYCRSSAPLFFEDIMSNEKRQKVLNYMLEVKRHAFSCIDKVKETDTSICRAPNNLINYNTLYSADDSLVKKGYLYINKKGNEITHVQRIIDSHISYLDQYRNHILRAKIGNYEKKEFSIRILQIIKEYIDKLKEIVSEEPQEEQVYYLGRYRNGDTEGRSFFESFETKLKEAQKNPLQIIWIQK